MKHRPWTQRDFRSKGMTACWDQQVRSEYVISSHKGRDSLRALCPAGAARAQVISLSLGQRGISGSLCETVRELPVHHIHACDIQVEEAEQLSLKAISALQRLDACTLFPWVVPCFL